MWVNESQFLELFLNDTPLIDLRAPVEFAKGSFPSAVSLPLMTDDERAEVGTCYKKQGQQAAIELGHQLVSGAVREERMAAWQQQIKQHPDTHLFCFRGGLRSRTVADWLKASGTEIPVVEGGYKALRRFLMETIEQQMNDYPLLIIGGRTGTRKTHLIEALPDALDLEGLANHRGSSFGRRSTPQPTVINFENHLAVALIKRAKAFPDLENPIILEDEGKTIGSCAIPEVMREKMSQADIILIEEDFETRVHNIYLDYVVDLQREYLTTSGDSAWQDYREAMLSALERIKKRLGGADYQVMQELMLKALPVEEAEPDYEAHAAWIRFLLERYYDPMYDYQLTFKTKRIRERCRYDELLTRLKA